MPITLKLRTIFLLLSSSSYIVAAITISRNTFNCFTTLAILPKLSIRRLTISILTLRRPTVSRRAFAFFTRVLLADDIYSYDDKRHAKGLLPILLHIFRNFSLHFIYMPGFREEAFARVTTTTLFEIHFAATISACWRRRSSASATASPPFQLLLQNAPSTRGR